MNNSVVDRCMAELKMSPMFHFSLASKELFHSNFFEWISTISTPQNPELGKQIFRSLFQFEEGDFTVAREWNHLDLVAKSADSDLKKPSVLLVVENKLKSIPYYDQILRYNELLQEYGGNSSCYLLTMMTEFSDRQRILDEGWNILTYNQMGDKLLQSIELIDDKYVANLIKDYCNFVSNLECLCREFLPPHDNKFLLNKEDRIKLQNLRILDLVDKMRMSAFAAKVKKSLPESEIRMGYGHGMAMMEIWYPKILDKKKEKEDKENNKNCRSFVIQVQGDKYSHGVYPCDDLSEDQCIKTYSQFFSKNLKDFRNSYIDEYPGIFAAMSRDNDSKFCKFKSQGDYLFRYQGVRISPEATFDDILKVIENDYHKLTHTS